MQGEREVETETDRERAVGGELSGLEIAPIIAATFYWPKQDAMGANIQGLKE